MFPLHVALGFAQPVVAPAVGLRVVPFGLPGALHRLRLFDAWQLLTVEVGQPFADRRQGQAGELFIQRMLPACLVDHDEAIAPVAVRQHQALGLDRRLERLAAVRFLPAIQNPRADRFDVRFKTAGFLKFLAVGAARPVARLALAAQLAQRQFFFQRARKLLEVVFKHAGVDGPFRLKIDAEPGNVQMLFTGLRIDVIAHHARQAGEAKPLFLAVNDLHPLPVLQPLVGR